MVRFIKDSFLILMPSLMSFLFVTLFSGCAYKLSNKVDALPGNAKVLFIPVFKNESTETQVESLFTDAMKNETLRSGYARLSNSENGADAVLLGTIRVVDVINDEFVIEAQNTKYLPKDSILSTKATVKVSVDLVLKKKGSSEVLWTGGFTQSKDYTPPQITLPTLNSANNLYNLSARRDTLSKLSKEMMQLAFDRMVDNF